MRTLLKHCHLVVDGNKEYLDGAILINDEHIEDVYHHSNKVVINENIDEEIDLQGLIVMPGFFDSHIHGSNGYSIEDNENINLNEIAKSLAVHGTTSFLATAFVGSEMDSLIKLNGLNTSYAKCHGIHLEGPFISKDKTGIIDNNKISLPNIEITKKILATNPNVKQMTIAPELEGSKDVINYLKQNNIKVMLGHSLATQKDLIDIDYDGFTHFYNAMSGFSHHELGLVNIGFDNKDKYFELIADGIHINKSVLKLTVNNLRRDRIMLISDATLAAGLNDGEYVFCKKNCIKDGKHFYDKESGNLSGSAVFILDEIKVLKELGLSYTDILLMSSLNAFRFYGLDNLYGTLQKGKYADLVILNDDLDLKDVYIRGKKNA